NGTEHTPPPRQAARQAEARAGRGTAQIARLRPPAGPNDPTIAGARLRRGSGRRRGGARGGAEAGSHHGFRWRRTFTSGLGWRDDEATTLARPTLVVDSYLWKVYPAGRITVYGKDEFGLLFELGTGPERKRRFT